MLVRELKLKNFGGFRDLTVPLANPDGINSNIAVFIGENGSGKSSILEAVTILLSWLVARIRSEKGNGSPFEEIRIHNGKPEASIELEIESDNKSYRWLLAKARRGRKRSQESDLKKLGNLADNFREQLTNNDLASLPLVAYYPTERYSLDIPQKIRTKHEFMPINGYDESLTKGIDFRRFFEWFREREDFRNEKKIPFDEILPYIDTTKLSQMTTKGLTEFLALIHTCIDKAKMEAENPDLYIRFKDEYEVMPDKQYFAVLKAIGEFMPGYKKLRIERNPLRMVINKDDDKLDILQLSQGERSLLALVGDIARRLAMMNPTLPDPLQGEGIVLIDEIDLHLHPRWQRTVIRNLHRTFPKCQFLLTTHSPLVINDFRDIQVFLLKDWTLQKQGNLYGMEIDQLLLEVMGAEIRDPELQDKLDRLFHAIHDRQEAEAKNLREQLSYILPPNHNELVRADIYMRKQRILDAKNH